MLSKTRVITAIWMACLLIPFLLLGGYFFYGLSIIFAYVATYELINMHNNKNNLPSFITKLVPLLSSIMVVVIMIADKVLKVNGVNYVVFSFLVIMILLLILPLFYKELKMTDGFFYIASIIYGGISFGVMALIRNIEINSSASFIIGSLDFNLSGLLIFVYILLTTMFTDIGAYEIGCRFGKHKLIPDVSPKKSVEGAIGGSLIGALMGTIGFMMIEYFCKFSLFSIENIVLKIIVVFLATLLLTIISQIGDLIASKLKREYGIKDFGKVFPGHGGVMDRFDSLILTSAVFFVILALFGVILC